MTNFPGFKAIDSTQFTGQAKQLTGKDMVDFSRFGQLADAREWQGKTGELALLER